MQDQASPALPPRPRGRRFGTALKLALIGGLIILLCIPLGMIRTLLKERLQRRGAVVGEITSTWGRSQSLVGPVLSVPYRYSYQTWKDQRVDGQMQQVQVTETAVATAHFLPTGLSFDGSLEPSVLHRGIYEAVVFTGEMAVSGTFDRPDFSQWKVDPADVLWEDATMSLGITDLRGARDELVMTVGDARIALTPGTRIGGLPHGVQGPIGDALRTAESLPFSVSLDFNGSGGISFAPLGKKTEVRLVSPWPDPKFRGAFLPTERAVTAEGFEATWVVSFYGRSFPQQWSGREGQGAFSLQTVQPSLFGVDLIQVVDSYRFVERATKHAILIIVLVFTAFFLFEVRSPIRVHPFQYLLVGFALCLFYLVILSFSEFVPNGVAYLVGALAATTMIGLYSSKALKGGRRASLVTGQLCAIYLVLFIILRLQEYSLLLGTVVLFAALAAVMFLTRNIDWYARDAGTR